GQESSRELTSSKRNAALLFAAACRCVTAPSAGRLASAGGPVPPREARGGPAPTRAEVVARVVAAAAAGADVTVVTAILAHDLLRSCCGGSGDSEFVLEAAGCRQQGLERAAREPVIVATAMASP